MRLPRSPERSLGPMLGKAWRLQLGATFLLIGCNTYDSSLLLPPQESRQPVTPGNGGGGPNPPSGGGGAGGENPASPNSSAEGGSGGAPAPAASPTTGSGGAGGDGGADPPDAGVSTGGDPPEGGGGSTDAGVAGGSGAGAGGEAGQGGAPTAGNGGTAGSAGEGGVGGVGGAEAGSAGMGGGGAAGAAGAGGAPDFDTCTGCARLTVPLDAATDYAHFTIVLPQATNLSAATIIYSVRRVEGSGGTFRGYVQQGPDDAFGYETGGDTPIRDLTTSMSMVSWDLVPLAASFDLTAIARVGIEISAEGSTSWSDPTVIDVDVIQVAGATPALSGWPFGMAGSVYTTPVEIYDPGPMWLNSYVDDTTAAGSSIEWLGQ